MCEGTRLNYGRYARAFLEAVSADSAADVAATRAGDVAGFVGDLASRYRPGTVALAASGLRSFLRFVRAEGLRGDRLEDAVPMVPRRRGGLVRHLEPGRLEQLIASLDSSSPRGLRDRAIILCMARLGIRASEIVRLRLEDLDWRNATVRVRARKTGHGALLPLTAEVGTALAVYLRDGRPGTAHNHRLGLIGDVADHFPGGRVRAEVAFDQVRDRPGGSVLFGERPAPRPRLAGHQAQLAHELADQLVADLLAASHQGSVDRRYPYVSSFASNSAFILILSSSRRCAVALSGLDLHS